MSTPVRLDTAGSTDQTHRLSRGTLAAAAIAVCVAQVALAIPAVLNGLFQQDLGTSSAQLTWISDAFLVPVTLLELTFGVLGDLFGRKRLLVSGTALLMVGQLISVLTPGAASSTGTRVLVLWIGQILSGLGAAAIFPTSLAMVAAGTHTARDRSRAISIWAAALSSGGFVSPVLGGWLARYHFGSDEFASWRWAFVAVIVLAAISTAVSAKWARNSSAPAGRSLDWVGQITIAVAMFALLYAVIQGPTSGWGNGGVIAGFIIAAVFLALFVVAELRGAAPLLRLDLFANRAFAIASIATVIGMFAYLGTAYATSIRLSAIQGFTPLKTSIAFLLLNGMALLMVPLTSRVLEHYNPRWTLGIGFTLIAGGDFWLTSLSASNLSVAPVIVPLLFVGTGFALALSSVTAVAVNTVPNHLAGMASGSTSMLRDFGFTLGPAVVGAIALSRAAAEISNKVNSSPALSKALTAFNGSAASAPAAQKPQLEAAIGAVNSGPLGANAVPGAVTLPNGQTVPFNPLKDVAFHALDHAYSIGYLVCGLSALAAALLAALGLGGRTHEAMISTESLAEDLTPVE
ncbi:MFS transporter [Actinocrinis sp.]|uniref:MFS transporter n=1 Tax=Actinocrinis sp. TaxID=1920516 RepID=UPI002D448DE6|nr:MFS transporter [Actinocrinis sp.]HZP49940.1 MFS transporter [Actinocrinis sp.]